MFKRLDLDLDLLAQWQNGRVGIETDNLDSDLLAQWKN
jgi:hypothetical protein